MHMINGYPKESWMEVGRKILIKERKGIIIQTNESKLADGTPYIHWIMCMMDDYPTPTNHLPSEVKEDKTNN